MVLACGRMQGPLYDRVMTVPGAPPCRIMRQRRFRCDPVATQMREQIRAFNSGALPGTPKGNA